MAKKADMTEADFIELVKQYYAQQQQEIAIVADKQKQSLISMEE